MSRDFQVKRTNDLKQNNKIIYVQLLVKSGEASGDIETDGSELFLGNDALFSWLDLALDGVSIPGVSSPLMAELIGRLCRLAVSDDCLSILSKSLFERDLRNNKNKGSCNFSLPCK